MVEFKIDISKRAFFVIILGFALIIAASFSFAVWNPDKAFFHDAEDVRVTIDSKAYSLQEAITDGMIGLNALDTDIVDNTVEDSTEQGTLDGFGCIKLDNEGGGYSENEWMMCPKGYYMAGITDDSDNAQDVFCCPFSSHYITSSVNPVLLNNGINGHDSDDCTVAGGTLSLVGGVYICKLPGASCLGGWSQYGSWSTTSARTCTGTSEDSSHCPPISCNIGYHGFSNTGIESCTYCPNRYYSNSYVNKLCICSEQIATCYATRTEIGCY